MTEWLPGTEKRRGFVVARDGEVIYTANATYDDAPAIAKRITAAPR